MEGKTPIFTGVVNISSCEDGELAAIYSNLDVVCYNGLTPGSKARIACVCEGGPSEAAECLPSTQWSRTLECSEFCVNCCNLIGQ